MSTNLGYDEWVYIQESSGIAIFKFKRDTLLDSISHGRNLNFLY